MLIIVSQSDRSTVTVLKSVTLANEAKCQLLFEQTLGTLTTWVLITAN